MREEFILPSIVRRRYSEDEMFAGVFEGCLAI